MNKKKEIIYLIIGVVTLMTLVIGATYAFFKAQTGPEANSSINATSGTTDNLTFTTTGEIVINASSSNFGKDGKDLNDSATATTTLIPNNTTNNASDTYNVYLLIEHNDIEYSRYSKSGEEDLKFLTKEEKAKANLEGYTEVPELYLTITAPEGKTTNIEGLTKVTLNSENDSYDITEKSGLITIARNVKIEATGKTKLENWNITITLKNLDSNQQLNTGKSLKGKVIIQKEELTIAKLLADANKIGQEETLLYHNGTIKDENGNILDAEDYSYRYSGSNDVVNNYICFGGDCSSEPDSENYSNLYRIIGLFPTDSSHNTYQLKIIKADYATEKELGGEGVGAYYGIGNIPNGNDYYKGNKEIYYPKIGRYGLTVGISILNDWSQIDLNVQNLNKYYLEEYLQLKDNGKWNNMIENHTWITEGNTLQNISNQKIKTAYINEIINPDVGTVLQTAAKTVTAKIGLMYVSDFGYAAYPAAWSNQVLLKYNISPIPNNNWLYMGLWEWLITRVSDLNHYNFTIGITGDIRDKDPVVSDDYFPVRPTMYLNSNVKIIDGDGSSTNPYKLSV